MTNEASVFSEFLVNTLASLREAGDSEVCTVHVWNTSFQNSKGSCNEVKKACMLCEVDQRIPGPILLCLISPAIVWWIVASEFQSSVIREINNDVYYYSSGSYKTIAVPCGKLTRLRDSQFIGMSGFSKEVFCALNKISHQFRSTKNHGRHIDTCVKVLDMGGLKLSALNQLKVVKSLLQERTRRKVHVLKGYGMEELLKVMDYATLPHFCRKEDSRVHLRHAAGNTENCFSFDHAFHKQLYDYIIHKLYP
ncbi:hypothetical protein VNO78_32060 [Psophocarpus tetragonolobus]|uniref:Uncharacterized protein n=1 Tax=Psophocarpus tetragonolobus TaxID=3891 RepID=A0AAN9RZ62_PSOTE